MTFVTLTRSLHVQDIVVEPTQGMRVKLYKMRGLSHQAGQNRLIDLDLEFDGKRAFAILDSIRLGNYKLKARLEIDPRLLKKITDECCDFFYRGKLVLPTPQNN